TAFAASAPSACSCPCPSGVLPLVQLTGVESLLDQLEDLVLAERLLVRHVLLRVLAELERERELAAGDLVERVLQQCRVLRVLGELQVERRRGRELEREPVLGELCGT